MFVNKIMFFSVYTEKSIILLTNITPEGILDEGHRAELSTYKGVMISKTNPEKDMFKINLLNMLGKQRKNSIFFNFSIAFLKNSCYH